MAYKVVFHRRAKADLDEAFVYIGDQAPELSANWYYRFKTEIMSLSEMPNRCSRIPEADRLGVELRQLILGKRSGRHRVIFRVVEDRQEVQIIAIRHGARKPLEPADIE